MKGEIGLIEFVGRKAGYQIFKTKLQTNNSSKLEKGCRFIESPMPDQRNSCCDYLFLSLTVTHENNCVYLRRFSGLYQKKKSLDQHVKITILYSATMQCPSLCEA